jgi:hypothetical protein
MFVNTVVHTRLISVYAQIIYVYDYDRFEIIKATKTIMAVSSYV